MDLIESLKKNEKGQMIVDCMYEVRSLLMNYLVKIDGGLSPVSKMWAEKVTKIPVMDFVYPMNNMYKKDGYKVPLGRPMRQDELDEIISRYNLTENEISESYEETKGECYGEKDMVKFSAIQIKIDGNPITLERELQKKGIEAFSGSSGRLTIRINNQ